MRQRMETPVRLGKALARRITPHSEGHRAVRLGHEEHPSFPADCRAPLVLGRDLCRGQCGRATADRDVCTQIFRPYRRDPAHDLMDNHWANVEPLLLQVGLSVSAADPGRTPRAT